MYRWLTVFCFALVSVFSSIATLVAVDMIKGHEDSPSYFTGQKAYSACRTAAIKDRQVESLVGIDLYSSGYNQGVYSVYVDVVLTDSTDNTVRCDFSVPDGSLVDAWTGGPPSRRDFQIR